MADELATGMSRLAGLLLSTGDLIRSLSDVADVVTTMLPERPMTGLVLLRADDVTVGGHPGIQRLLVEEAGIAGGLGPSREAIATGEPVSSPDLAMERRWTGYPKRAQAQGIRCVYSQPFGAGEDVAGALELYARRPTTFGDETCRATAFTAEHLGVLLAIADNAAEQSALAGQLRAALVSRSAIDQALGILMGRYRCSRDDAFARLRAVSQHRNVKVAELAGEIVESVSGLPPAPVHFDEARRRAR
ncbi:GAF and ANTAR domain-containing protein [Nocardia sp. NPDC052566]|uniref:GAF and ANTAR domain-containing protein n=1 Tax=Nocardia sp. NPDC052566 TaxID=3364330 RepID=UPI0037C623BB